MSNGLHEEFERSREAVWAHGEDIKILAALRAKLEMEAQMADNVAALQRPSTA